MEKRRRETDTHKKSREMMMMIDNISTIKSTHFFSGVPRWPYYVNNSNPSLPPVKNMRMKEGGNKMVMVCLVTIIYWYRHTCIRYGR